MDAVVHPDTQQDYAVVGIAFVDANVLDTSALLRYPRGQSRDDAAVGFDFYTHVHQKLSLHRGCPTDVADFLRFVAQLRNVAAGVLVYHQPLARAYVADDRVAGYRAATAGEGNQHTFGGVDGQR